MIFYRALEKPFLHPDQGLYCLIVQGSKDGNTMEPFEVFFNDLDEAYAVWKSFLDRFDFHTNESLDEVVTAYRQQAEEKTTEDN